MVIRILFFSFLSLIISACSPSTDTSIVSSESPVIPAPIVAPVVVTTPLLLRGTEPFWSFVQSATGSAVFSLPGDPVIEEYNYTTTEVMAGTDIIITATPVTLGDTPISVLVSPGTCSDGMSDIVYPYTVSLSYGMMSYTGCGQ